MKTLLFTAVIISQLITGHALAEQLSAEEVLAQCEQEAKKAGAENIEDYVYDCLQKKREYDQSE